MKTLARCPEAEYLYRTQEISKLRILLSEESSCYLAGSFEQCIEYLDRRWRGGGLARHITTLTSYSF
jgi:hypothetical protein